MTRIRQLALAALAVATFTPAVALAQAAPPADPLVAAGYLVNGEIDGSAVAADAEQIPVAAPAPGYDRDLFPHWRDPDGNGCDARNDVLQRDLDGVVLRDGSDCIVESGVLHDPYTGTKIEFKRGASTSSAVQIDHVVPLSAAWSGGANTWTPEQREAFANDPENLIAVDGPTNSAKSDSLPGEWMPTNETFHCEYVARVTDLLTRYDLSFTSEQDKEQILATAATCTLTETTPATTPQETSSPEPGSPPSEPSTTGTETLASTDPANPSSTPGSRDSADTTVDTLTFSPHNPGDREGQKAAGRLANGPLAATGADTSFATIAAIAAIAISGGAVITLRNRQLDRR